jgi:hypothetical protein
MEGSPGSAPDATGADASGGDASAREYHPGGVPELHATPMRETRVEAMRGRICSTEPPREQRSHEIVQAARNVARGLRLRPHARLLVEPARASLVKAGVFVVETEVPFVGPGVRIVEACFRIEQARFLLEDARSYERSERLLGERARLLPRRPHYLERPSS